MQGGIHRYQYSDNRSVNLKSLWTGPVNCIEWQWPSESVEPGSNTCIQWATKNNKVSPLGLAHPKCIQCAHIVEALLQFGITALTWSRLQFESRLSLVSQSRVWFDHSGQKRKTLPAVKAGRTVKRLSRIQQSKSEPQTFKGISSTLQEYICVKKTQSICKNGRQVLLPSSALLSPP